jgi:hypothetical protein
MLPRRSIPNRCDESSPHRASTSSQLGIAEVTEVGRGLDRKVANLLRVIGVDPGEAFGA